MFSTSPHRNIASDLEGEKKISSGSGHCVCLCFTTKHRDNAAALSFAHSCCFLSESVCGQWRYADPMRCRGILTPIWLIFDFSVHDTGLGHCGFSWILIFVTIQLCLQFKHIGSKNRTIIYRLVDLIKA